MKLNKTEIKHHTKQGLMQIFTGLSLFSLKCKYADDKNQRTFIS